MPAVRFGLNAAHAPEAFRIGYANLDESELQRLVSLLVNRGQIL